MTTTKNILLAVIVTLLMAGTVRAQNGAASQIGNNAFDSLNRALRVDAVATGGGGGSSSSFLDLDQLLSSVYDPTHNALKVNVVSGLPCSADGSGALDCTATGSNQPVKLQPSGTPENAQVFGDGNGGLYLSIGETSIWDNAAANYTGISARNNLLLLLNGTDISLHGGTSNGHSIDLSAPNDTTQEIKASDDLAITPGDNHFVTIRSLNTGYVEDASAATMTLNAASGNVQAIMLTGNVTSFTITNAAAGETIQFIWEQDATGGHTVAGPPANMYGFTPPGTTANSRSIQSCTYDGTDWTCEPAAINLTHP